MTNPYTHWILSTQDHIATLTLNRAHAMNSLTAETLYELEGISKRVAEDEDIWALVLTSAGEHFSVGVDVGAIGQMVGQDPQAYRAHLGRLQACLDAFESIPQPTIASIRGYCIGGGLLMALCCDFRVADTSAIFYLPEVALGIAVIMGTQRITRVAGIPATKAMVLLAERFSAQQAQTYGLLHDLVAPDVLASRVEQLAHRFRQLPPRTVRVAKRIIDEGASMTLADSQQLEMTLQEELLTSEDFQEGVRAFFEKRPPRFTGH